jgi:copper chaperone
VQLPSRAIIKYKWVDIVSEYSLRIDGMHCGSCIRRVSQALASTRGIKVEEVRLGAARFSATESIEKPAPVDLALAALANAGYTARLDQ